MAAGAPQGGDSLGAVYWFTRSGATWVEQPAITASSAAADTDFGASVALSGDTLLAGAPGSSLAPAWEGRVFAFNLSGAAWTEEQVILASDGAGSEGFGGSVAVAGELALVGNPADTVGANPLQGSVYSLAGVGAAWAQEQKLTSGTGAAGSGFGCSVALSGDTALVGADGDDVGANDAQGAAYVLFRDVGPWAVQQRLLAADGAAADQFGWSTALAGDTALIGAYEADVGGAADQGAAYVFVREGASWTEQQKLVASDGGNKDYLGYAVALSGDTALVGAPGFRAASTRGAAYVFVRTATSWVEQQQLLAADGSDGDWFGARVALAGDTAVIGAPNDSTDSQLWHGSVYVFERSGDVWTQRDKLTAHDAQAGALFGSAVAISSSTAVIGAYGLSLAGALQGSAYVFTLDGTVWAEQQKLAADDGEVSDCFGYTVGVSGDVVLVGAPHLAIYARFGVGAAYVFSRADARWGLAQRVAGRDGAEGDVFGGSVAIDGTTTLIGSPAAHGVAPFGNPDEGAVLFGRIEDTCPAGGCPADDVEPAATPAGGCDCRSGPVDGGAAVIACLMAVAAGRRRWR